MADMSSFTIHFSVLVWTSFLTSIKSLDLTCNKEGIYLCYSNLRKSPVLTQTIPYVNDTHIPTFCKSFESFSHCYAPIQPKCLNDLPLNTAAELEGVHASYDFMCRSGAEDYKKSKDCFSNSDLQSQSETCRTALKKHLNESNEINYAERVKQKCSAGLIYISCIDTYVRVLCEDDKTALKWINTFNTKSLKPLFSVYRCPGFDPQTTTKNVEDNMILMVGVFGALLAVVIVLIIIVIVCFFFKYKHHRKFCSGCVCFNWILQRFINKPPPYNPDIVNSLPAVHTNMPSSSVSENPLGVVEFNERQKNEIYLNETSRDNSPSSSQLPYKSSTPSFFLNKSFSSFQNCSEKDSNLSSKTIVFETSPDNTYSCASTSSTYYDTVHSHSLDNIDDLTEHDYY